MEMKERLGGFDFPNAKEREKPIVPKNNYTFNGKGNEVPNRTVRCLVRTAEDRAVVVQQTVRILDSVLTGCS